MPTYGYECKSCGHNFDVFQSMSDEPVKVCPKCGREVRRLINGGTGVIFKGSGFYVTDKGKEKPAANSPKPAAAKAPESSSQEKTVNPPEKAKPEPAKSTGNA
jgi:putative FmdB family regulatory protein